MAVPTFVVSAGFAAADSRKDAPKNPSRLSTTAGTIYGN